MEMDSYIRRVFVFLVALVVLLQFCHVADAALGGTCTSDTDCSSVANSACTGTGSKTCTCKNGYKASATLCAPVHDSVCTNAGDCNALTNSACEGTDGNKKCTCTSGYQYKTDTAQCDKVKSSSVLWQPSLLLLVMSTFLVLLGI